MKKFLALVLALLMALSCFSFAGADTTETCTSPEQHVIDDSKGFVTKSEATCTKKEVREYTCARCHNTFTREYGNVLPHEGGIVNDVTPANCDHGTITSYDKCTRCGEAYTVEANDKLEHEWEDVKDSEVPATCTTPATKQRQCKICKKIETVKTHDATGHDFSNVATDLSKAPTCTTPGAEGKAFYCQNPGCTEFTKINPVTKEESDLKEIPALTHSEADGTVFTTFINHFFTVEDGKLTGIASGLTLKEGKETISATGISTAYGVEKGFELDYKAVTCTEDGHLTVTCLDCGKSWTVTVKSTGHEFKLAKVFFFGEHGVESTTFELKPDMTTEDLVEKWKNFVETHNVVDCDNPVDVHYVCGKPGCKAEVEAEGFTLEHDFAHGTIVGYRQQKYGEQLPVDYTAEEVTEVAKCQPYTVITRCKYCEQLQETAGKVEDHVLDNGEERIYEEATCAKEGSKLVKCVNCNYTKLVTIPKSTIHTYDETKTVIVPATCTEPGSRTKVCTVCGEKLVQVIPAIGHQWDTTVKGGDNGVGTCLKPLTETKVCKFCKKTETTVVDNHYIDLTRAEVGKDILVEYKGHLVYDRTTGKVTGVQWDDCSEAGNVKFICKYCCKTVAYQNDKNTAHKFELDTTGYPDDTGYEGYGAGYTAAAPVRVDDVHCKVVITAHYKCTECGKPDTKEITIEIKHEPVKGFKPIIESGNEPTCTKAGEGYYKCEHCGKLYKAAVEAKLHNYVTTWDGEKWVYTCSLCGDVKTLDYTAEKYVIKLDKVTFGARTEGYATVTLENSLTPAGIFGTRYAYIRWTWTGANNEKWVAEDTRMIVDGKIDMKGMKAPVGTTLTEVLVIVTGEKNADSMQLGDFSNYGHVIK